jgi:hypothetical protein
MRVAGTSCVAGQAQGFVVMATTRVRKVREIVHLQNAATRDENFAACTTRWLVGPRRDGSWGYAGTRLAGAGGSRVRDDIVRGAYDERLAGRSMA